MNARDGIDEADAAPAEDATQDDQRVRVQAVERSLALLQCFREPGESLSLALLAQRSGFYKSTILRLSASLVHMNFLRRDTRGQYALGSELRRLGALSDAHLGLDDLIRPVLRALSASTRETVSFYIRDGMERICLLRVNSPRSTRHHLVEGTRHPLKRGAAGRVLWAFDPDFFDEDGTVAVRNRGWVFSKGERDPDLAGVAVPIFNYSNELIGALTVSGLLSRFTDDEVKTFRNALLHAAASLRPRLPLKKLLVDASA
jgi:DNA-binding IclR family transcriptional regulator